MISPITIRCKHNIYKSGYRDDTFIFGICDAWAAKLTPNGCRAWGHLALVPFGGRLVFARALVKARDLGIMMVLLGYLLLDSVPPLLRKLHAMWCNETKYFNTNIDPSTNFYTRPVLNSTMVASLDLNTGTNI